MSILGETMKAAPYLKRIAFFIALALAGFLSPVPQAHAVVTDCAESSFSAKTLEGQPLTIQPDSNTVVIFAASWCHVCRGFKKLLSTPSLKPYIGNRRVVLLLYDEWPGEQRRLKSLESKGKLGSVTAEQALAAEMKRSGSDLFYDPSFKKDIPGEAYVCEVPKDVNYFPCVVVNGKCQWWQDWIETLGIPRPLLDQAVKNCFP
jgi:hypothetical protein